MEKIKNLIDKLDKYKNYLKEQRSLNKSIIKVLEKDIKTSYIYNTNAIEGKTLTYNKTELILDYGMTVKGKSLREHLEVKVKEYAIDKIYRLWL